MNSFYLFKDIFREELVFLYSIDTDEEVYEIAEIIFENERNYNNTDVSSGQYIFSLEDIENYCHIIYGSDSF